MATNKEIDKILKDYKDLGITRASDATKYEFYSTPFSTVNNLIGGIPRARFCTIAGPEHTGKGAFCAQLIAHLQAEDPDFVCLWSDFESSFDDKWASNLGVDLDRLLIQRYTTDVDTMEKALDQALEIVKSVKPNMWIIDSIGALIPKGDVYDSKGTSKSLENPNMLNLQRKLGEFYRKANIMIAPSKDYKGCAVILIGQIYTVPDAHTTLEAVKGGNAVKHWAHLRLMFRRGPKSDWPEKVKIKTPDGETREVFPGWSGRIKVEKTRINANEGKEVLLPFKHGLGFDSKSTTINSAFGLGLIARTGAYYSSPHLPEGKVQGKETVIKFFNDNQEAYNKLYQDVMSAAMVSVEDAKSDDEDA